MTAVVTAEMLAEALFASDLQPSDRPGTRLVQDTVTATVFHYGEVGCAERVATEFGDHPEAACQRMAWCRKTVKDAYGA